MFKAFVDESGDSASGHFAVALCLFAAPRAEKFEQRWSRVFAPYGGCHMVDLVHGRKAFEGISPNRRDELIKAAVPLLRGHLEAGLVVSCRVRDVGELALDVDGYRSPYAVCCVAGISALMRWLRVTGRRQHVSYTFEAGHKDCSEVDRIMRRAARSAEESAIWRYAGHSFVSKGSCVLLEASDFFGWEFMKFWRDVGEPMREGRAVVRPPRKDFRALHGHPSERADSDNDKDPTHRRFQLVAMRKRTLLKSFGPMSEYLSTLSPEQYREVTSRYV